MIIAVTYDAVAGWLAVEHDGTITWDELQALKNEHMGEDVMAIEVYPKAGEVLNNANVRHLWRFPDLGVFAAAGLG